tara:strand:- start:330 stop:488 length:159 start_codon:yes stop_codon:yes gene_type:complete
MKTRTMTNKNRDSYRVDVIDKGKLLSHYFKTEKEANSFVKWKQNLNKYKEFI